MRFGLKLAGLFILFGVLPLLIVSHFASQSSQQALIDQAREHVASLSVLKGDELRKWMNGNTALLESVASRPGLSDLAGRLLATPRSDGEWEGLAEVILTGHLEPNTAAGGIEELYALHPTTY